MNSLRAGSGVFQKSKQAFYISCLELYYYCLAHTCRVLITLQVHLPVACKITYLTYSLDDATFLTTISVKKIIAGVSPLKIFPSVEGILFPVFCHLSRLMMHMFPPLGSLQVMYTFRHLNVY